MRHHHLLCLARRNTSFLRPNPPYTRSTSSSHFTASGPPPPLERVSAIVDDISCLTILEIADLMNLLHTRLRVAKVPMMAVVAPGMEEEKKENTTFELKLESFDATTKIKIIKEVKTFTDLGLKEAKDLVEKAPTVLKKEVMKEEAEKIVEKLEELGAKVVLE